VRRHAVGTGEVGGRSVVGALAARADLGERYGTDERPERLSGRFANDEIGRVADKLQHAGQRLHAAMARERKFSRYASHELRSPVTIIQGAVELIEAHGDTLTPTVSRPLGRISRAAQDMARIIDIFLWYGGRGQHNVEHELTDVAELVHELVKVHSYLLDHKDVVAQVTVHDKPMLEVNPAALTVVLGNLLSNAFRFTHKGAVGVAVHHQRVEVRDSGEGIAVDELKHVFELGVHGQGPSSGYGLGLSIVRDLCTELGWRVTLDSAEGDGTRVTLWFDTVSPTAT